VQYLYAVPRLIVNCLDLRIALSDFLSGTRFRIHSYTIDYVPNSQSILASFIHYQLRPSSHLRNNGRVSGGSQLGSASEGLSTSLDINKVQARAQALVVDQVGEESEHVTGEAGDGGLGDEAVNSHGAVGTLVQFPGDTVDGGSGNRRAGGGDRASTTQGSEPDHDLVLVRARGTGAQEHVVGDIRDDAGGGVAVDIAFVISHSASIPILCGQHSLQTNLPPRPRRLNAADAAQSLRSELQRNIGKALDLAGGAGPRVGGVPGNGGAAQRVNTSALGAGGVGAQAPEVIVDDIAARSGRSPLVTEVGTTSQ
jgi:hypothetical protein